MNTGELYDTMNDLAVSLAAKRFANLPKSYPGENLEPTLRGLAESMGVCVAVWAGYRGDLIMDVAIAALEEANYHGEAAQLREMLEAR